LVLGFSTVGVGVAVLAGAAVFGAVACAVTDAVGVTAAAALVAASVAASVAAADDPGASDAAVPATDAAAVDAVRSGVAAAPGCFEWWLQAAVKRANATTAAKGPDLTVALGVRLMLHLRPGGPATRVIEATRSLGDLRVIRIMISGYGLGTPASRLRLSKGSPMASIDARPGPAYVPTRNGLGTAALVLGIAAILLSWTVIGGVLFGLIAIGLGIAGRGRAKQGLATNGGSATAGAVTGLLGVLIAGALIAFGLSFLNSPAGKSLTQCLKNAHSDKTAIAKCQQQYVNSH
jgi:hypothetical protein